ncbi:hypothetical protein FQN60_013569 [Etheostoma spectabile]|uniref:Uncharacterized protein n=1 Tax=Etheostoma spectabile TaxID=54343 RepID=A0A5J5CKI2_9PERO|nr:hypothetical protein FQN60_013569 [Etheostoma spectabile]
MFKMRGVTLLCLLGIGLTASTQSMLERGVLLPMENENGTNTTTNSSLVIEDRRQYNIVQQKTFLQAASQGPQFKSRDG